MENYYIQGTRKLDGRNVYVKSECSLPVWINVIDSLHDSEFVVTSITEKKYLSMSKRTKWHYEITNKSSNNFIMFIEENYKKTIEINNKESKKQQKSPK